MSNEMTVITVPESRPSSLHDGWIVCQAPRPLWGHVELESVWHRIAIDPRHADAREMLDYASDMKAQVIEFCSDEHLERFAAIERASLGELGISVSDADVLAHIKNHLYLYNRTATVAEILVGALQL